MSLSPRGDHCHPSGAGYIAGLSYERTLFPSLFRARRAMPPGYKPALDAKRRHRPHMHVITDRTHSKAAGG